MKQTNIAITSLHPFAGNPYQVRDDAEMDVRDLHAADRAPHGGTGR